MVVSKRYGHLIGKSVPVYCDLKVESILSAGIERTAVVATLFTSSGSKVRISILMNCWMV